MRNLASRTTDRTSEIQQELSELGISSRLLFSDHADPEVPSKVCGQVGPFLLVRRWVYWSARPLDSKGVPPDLAAKIQQAPYNGPRTHNSGYARKLGSVVRVNGYSGGIEPSRAGGVDYYHLDTALAVKDFAALVRDYYGL